MVKAQQLGYLPKSNLSEQSIQLREKIAWILEQLDFPEDESSDDTKLYHQNIGGISLLLEMFEIDWGSVYIDIMKCKKYKLERPSYLKKQNKILTPLVNQLLHSYSGILLDMIDRLYFIKIDSTKCFKDFYYYCSGVCDRVMSIYYFNNRKLIPHKKSIYFEIYPTELDTPALYDYTKIIEWYENRDEESISRSILEMYDKTNYCYKKFRLNWSLLTKYDREISELKNNNLYLD
jgi:hypothetical protein